MNKELANNLPKDAFEHYKKVIYGEYWGKFHKHQQLDIEKSVIFGMWYAFGFICNHSSKEHIPDLNKFRDELIELQKCHGDKLLEITNDSEEKA